MNIQQDNNYQNMKANHLMSHLVDSYYHEKQSRSPYRLASKKGFEKVNFVLN